MTKNQLTQRSGSMSVRGFICGSRGLAERSLLCPPRPDIVSSIDHVRKVPMNRHGQLFDQFDGAVEQTQQD
jgi:hypothetical protein